MKRWDEVRDWRRAKRAELRSRRVSLPRDEKDRVRATVTTLLRQHVPEFAGACIGFCWPYKGEIDFRHFIRSAVADGAEAALPVVVERAQPLEFWSWRPHNKMQRGIWNIPIPADRRPVQPTVLLVPLVGFDESGYRLGYGGGYFDRTLATAMPRPLTIGVGYELGRLETIYPQPHDIPMDAIVTEAGFAWHARPRCQSDDTDGVRKAGDDTCRFASSPCMMHEIDPSSLGYLSDTELLDLLGQMLEGERAGARGVGTMSRLMPASATQSALHEVARDEARFCAMLTRHIVRLGGTPSRATGSFYEKLLAPGEFAERLDLLNRGQGWVVRKLREALLKIDDDALRRDLTDMLATRSHVAETSCRRQSVGLRGDVAGVDVVVATTVSPVRDSSAGQLTRDGRWHRLGDDREVEDPTKELSMRLLDNAIGSSELRFREPYPILSHQRSRMMTQQNTQPAFHQPQPNAAALADAGLVTRVRAGDPIGFEMIMRRHNQRLYRLARGILRNGSEAEDVVQEAYVRSYEKLDDFVGPNGFGAWLGKIVVNEALGRLRKRGRVISLDDHVRSSDGSVAHHRIETMMATQPDPERLAASGELRRLIENAIDTLPDDFRMVFVLRAVEGLNVSETAQYLSIRPETVKTRFHRARRLLQSALGAEFETYMPSAFAFAGQRCDRIVATVLGRLGYPFEARDDRRPALGHYHRQHRPSRL